MADTHGIVYTPQAIVDFMVRSVEALLRREFGRSLADPGVHLLDPFVGTGNFILRVMRHLAEIGKLGSLPHKYAHELHCNEVMLLPYYIAAMNIEHEYYGLTGQYAPFDGICLVDTFELGRGDPDGPVCAGEHGRACRRSRGRRSPSSSATRRITWGRSTRTTITRTEQVRDVWTGGCGRPFQGTPERPTRTRSPTRMSRQVRWAAGPHRRRGHGRLL